MKKILVLGAGMVTNPMVDYFIDKCGYHVTIATRTVSKAERILDGRDGRSVAWTTDQGELLDELVGGVDLIVSMIPPTMHVPVARSCIKLGKNMVTTSYISPEMAELDSEAKEAGIIILNEIGMGPGICQMGMKQQVDGAQREGGEIESLALYSAGLPSFEHNNNPLGYKFSWSPRGVILAANTPAAYLKDGERVEIPAEKLFDHHRLVDIEGLGIFETYPNRDVVRYLKYYGVAQDINCYRGVLRFTGWCSTMISLKKLNLLDDTEVKDFTNKTYGSFMASLVGGTGNVIADTAVYLGEKENSDIIKRIRWLGLFDERQIAIENGSNADLLVDIMIKKMSYKPGEVDMIIIHNEVVVRFGDRKEKRWSTMVKKGIPGGHSAMAMAVSFPAAIASKLILESKISAKGVHRSILPEVYEPVLKELEDLGLSFQHGRE